MIGSNCDCLICRLEKRLIAEVRDTEVREEYRSRTASSQALSAFTTFLDLIKHLHASNTPDHSGSVDALLLELLRENSTTDLPSLWQRLLLLAFIPTIHRTTSQITAMFPSLTRDDTSQHILSVFLEFLHSAELQTRRSHIAFTIARRLRRSAFRWAIHESRSVMPEEMEGHRTPYAEDVAAETPLHAEILLQQFLDTCQKTGWLSAEERHLLVQFKIEGASCQELARRNGHSAVAIQHRIQRLLNRLRRHAQKTWRSLPEQLELFPP
jgi:DNA-directed RNA polymerase specialized sigma24 family protein